VTSIPPPVLAVSEAVRVVSGVTEVELTGSSAVGERTPLSDWDFDVAVEDAAVLEDLEHRLQRLRALAVFWDPLSTRANLIVLLEGPIKVDVIVPAMGNPRPISQWEVTAPTLARVDAHFWDWTLWLGAKQLRGLRELVAAELAKMWDTLLRPMGVQRSPQTLDEAVNFYLVARREREHELEAPSTSASSVR
jgi:hypothetical protein